MELDDAFKESPIKAAKRVEGKHEIFIRHLLDNEGFLLKNFLLTGSNTLQLMELKVFPRLGALLNHALKKGYKEAKRYAKDWQPMSYKYREEARFQKSSTPFTLPSKKEIYRDESEDYSDESEGMDVMDLPILKEHKDLNVRLDYIMIPDERLSGKRVTIYDLDLDYYGYFEIDEDDDQEKGLVYGLDGRLEYNGRDDEDDE